jgi:hypothetical protein
MASSPYRYEPLPNESFRLFRIEDTNSELIQIHPFEAAFIGPPGFEGESLDTSTILCDGQTLSVATNVEAILRRLRQTSSFGTFWIDSMCINQVWIPERNVQVPRMRSICNEARLV